jgi:hypothetical protein
VRKNIEFFSTEKEVKMFEERREAKIGKTNEGKVL